MVAEKPRDSKASFTQAAASLGQTVAHLRELDRLQPGDAVFFERGGTYLIAHESLQLRDQVTYSEYGVGE